MILPGLGKLLEGFVGKFIVEASGASKDPKPGAVARDRWTGGMIF